MNARVAPKALVPIVKSDHRFAAMGGYVLVFLTFGLFGGWAATAPLDSAVIAPGTMVAESNRKTLQHFEGGIVREIRVRDGQHVKEGDLLFRLDDVQARANLDLLQNQFDATRVLEARLTAERDFSDQLSFPSDILAKKNEPHVAQAIADQVNHFNERRASLVGQIEILESRVVQLEREAAGLGVELAALREQVQLIDEELVDMVMLLQQNLIQRPRVFAHKRERARIEGSVGRSEAEIAKAKNASAEMRLQIRQLRQKFAEEVSAQLTEVRQRLSDIGERTRVARDVLARTLIVAPQNGVVQGLRVFTIGAVVRAAEPLLEIAPDEDKFYVNAQIAPTDVDKIPPDAVTEVRFPSFPAATTPIISGRVKSTSRDRLIDEATRLPYFLVQVEVSVADVPPELRGRLHAGIPADVVIATGERTLLTYLVKPLTDRVNRSLREQ